MKKILKRSISLFLLLTLCVGTFFLHKDNVAAADNNVYVYLFPRGSDNNKSNWGREKMTYMNGWSQRAVDTFSVYSTGDNGKVYYCIEPGHSIKSGDTFDEIDTERNETYWDEFPANGTIDRDELRSHIGRIFQYGYIGNINLNWTSQNNADTLGNVIATQILIWEVVVGERDSNFNHVDPGSYDAILDSVSKSHPVYNQIMSHYNRIVRQMQGHLDYPSFMKEKPNEAIVVELKWNGSEYIATLVDENGVLNKYDFYPSNPNVRFEKNGNTLIIKSSSVVNNVSIQAVRTEHRKGLIVWSSETRQDLVRYTADVSDPLEAFIKVNVSTGMIYGYKTKLDDTGKQVGLEGAKIGLFPAGTTDFSEKNALQICISGQTIPGTTSYHPGGYYFTNVSFGSYIIKEIEAPDGFKLSDEVRNVTLNSNRLMVPVSIVNKKELGDIYGFKVDGDNEPLSGATIGIFNKDETTFTEETAIQISTTGQTIPNTQDYHNGCYVFNDLEYDTYLIKELKAPNGFAVNDKVIEVTLNTDLLKVTETIKNEKIKGSIIGHKIDAQTGLPLSGAVIGLFPPNPIEITEEFAYKTYSTSSDGYFEFTDLNAGVYSIREISAPGGYMLSDAAYRYRITQNNQVIEFDLLNDKFYVDIPGIKVNPDNEPLSGATIGLFKADETSFTEETAIFTQTTKSDGSFVFENLARGIYVIREIIPAPGCTLNDTKYIVKVINENKVMIDDAVYENEDIQSIQVKIVNLPLIITGSKVDGDNLPLSGATIGLFNADETTFTKDTAIQTSVTDIDGKFSFIGVQRGRYIIREILPPEGYMLNTNLYTLIVSAYGTYHFRDVDNTILDTLKITNILNPHSITITKVDSNGNTLSGAAFLIEWSTDGTNYTPLTYNQAYISTPGTTTTNVVNGEAVVSDTGILTFDGLCPNLYYRITETKAPEGFNLLTKPVFEGLISSNDDIQIGLNVINTPIFVLPSTGGYANYIVPISVIASGLIAFLAIYLIKNNKKGFDKNEKNQNV